MSSKLKKKSKNKYLDKKDMANIRAYTNNKRKTYALIEESYYNIRLIAYQVLHDKFGFGKKRIVRVENTVDAYMESEDGLSTLELLLFMKEKYKIDIREEVNKVPFSERFALIRSKVAISERQYAESCISASARNYFATLGVCLKTQFKFSTRQIKEVYEWIRYYINTLSRQKQFDLTLIDIAECLIDEVGYCDFRYARG